MIKCKKLLTAIFVLALIPLFTLPVYASDNDALKTLQKDLQQAITVSEQITDALNEEKPVGTIAKMIRNIKEIDTSVLGDPQDAPKTGSMITGTDSADSVQQIFANCSWNWPMRRRRMPRGRLTKSPLFKMSRIAFHNIWNRLVICKRRQKTSLSHCRENCSITWTKKDFLTR